MKRLEIEIDVLECTILDLQKVHKRMVSLIEKPNYKYDSFEEWLDSLNPNFNSEREFLEAIKEMFEAAREGREDV